METRSSIVAENTECIGNCINGISIIIPAYNEAKRIGNCVNRIISVCESYGWNYELIIAAEGSTDDTVKVVEAMFSSLSEKITILTGSKRLGKGGSIKEAVKCAKMEYIVYMDSDLSADPTQLDRLLQFANEYDVVIGSRIVRGGLPPISRPVARGLFSHLYSVCFRVMFMTQIRDPQCGFKLFKKSTIDRLFNSTRTCGFAFDTEILVRAMILGLKIKEVPIVWTHDKDGSKVRISKQVPLMASDLISIRIRTLFNRGDTTSIQPRLQAS